MRARAGAGARSWPLCGTDGALAGVQGHLLVLQLLALHPGGLSTRARLQPGKDGANFVLALLLHPAANADPEEDLGAAQPELFLVQLDNLHDGPSSSPVVLCRVSNSCT